MEPLPREVRRIVAGARDDLRRSWQPLVRADLAYKALAFGALAPAAALLLGWFVPHGRGEVLADLDILRFFVTTPAGIASLVVVGGVLTAINVLEVACLLEIGSAAAAGRRLRAVDALARAAARAPRILALTWHMVLRVLAGAAPFLVAAGLLYVGLLTRHDINYYLAEKPPAFWATAIPGALLAAALAALGLRTVVRWAFVVPLVLFEGVLPRRAFRESARRAAGRGPLVLGVLAAWATAALAMFALATWLPALGARALAPLFAGSLERLLAFLTVLVVVWGAVGLVAGIANVSLFALLLNHLYLCAGGSGASIEGSASAAEGGVRIPPRVLVAGVLVVLSGAVGVVLLLAAGVRRNQPVLVIAHRGASLEAPENTLAAFRLAAEQGTDFVELDVQESADGEVVVVHDSDLMKVGGAAVKIWAADAATLRSVDVGSHADPRFASERVPTLAEALEICRGRCRVVVELKSYGHAERLEERVASIVEAAGMGDGCVFMSLDQAMVRRMKELRPAWRSGVLTAKAVGDLTSLPADFLAVEKKLATRRFVRHAHRTGKEVWVWTVNDPADMLGAMSRGVDGLITDRPDLARRVIERRAGMSDAQRVLVALLVRLGASTEALAAEDALRP